MKHKALTLKSINVGPGDPVLKEVLQIEHLVRANGVGTCAAIAIEQGDGTFALRVTLGRTANPVALRIKHHNRPRLFTTMSPILRCAKRFGFNEIQVQLFV
jgi:hypothetical protein